jgi:diaminohydroxyphosphoribosylaminopyrimidine deaminase / 5-amino-6-(5-phosphoribosylamino)uracil reductase
LETCRSGSGHGHGYSRCRYNVTVQNPESAEASAWNITHAAAEAQALTRAEILGPACYALAGSELRVVAADDPSAVLRWNPAIGWVSLLASHDPQRDLVDLYLPICSATAARPITFGHLGQSLDGFIATSSGDSRWVTGPENILHMHRLRALCDAVIIGAGTVEADDPRLTTRLVAGSNPLRVVIDPACRLPAAHTVFSDRQAPTVRATVPGTAAAAAAAAAARARGEDILEVRALGNSLDLGDLLHQLRSRGHCRIFVEGGGVTVSSFLEAGLLDRLHITVAPLLIGQGRPTLRISPRVQLRDCLWLHHRVYRAGLDILFDCDLRATAGSSNGACMPASATVQRIL